MVLQNITTNESLNWKKYSYLQKPQSKRDTLTAVTTKENDATLLRSSSASSNSRDTVAEAMKDLLLSREGTQEGEERVAAASPSSFDAALPDAFALHFNVRFYGSSSLSNSVDFSSLEKKNQGGSRTGFEPSFFNPFNRNLLSNFLFALQRKAPKAREVGEAELEGV